MIIALSIIATLIICYSLIILGYYLLQEKIIFIPVLVKPNFQFQLTTDFEELYLEGEENGIINCIHIKVNDPRGVILYFHGNTGSLKKWSLTGEELSTFGFDVFLMDYRGYGKSKGKRNETLLHSDALNCYNYLKERYPENKIVIYGRSLGSGMAVKLASIVKPARLILETPYYSLRHLAQYYFPLIPVKYLVKYPFRSDLWIHDVSCPIAIFHGTKDKVIPFKYGLKLYEEIGEGLQHSMVTIPRGKHSNLNSYPLFREKMREILQQV